MRKTDRVVHGESVRGGGRVERVVFSGSLIVAGRQPQCADFDQGDGGCRVDPFASTIAMRRSPMPVESRSAQGLTLAQQARRARILAVATDILTRQGYDGVTMRELARHSGVAMKTLYDIYGSKDGLLISAVRDRVARKWREADESARRRRGLLRFFHVVEAITGSALETEILSRGVSGLIVSSEDFFAAQDVYDAYLGGALREVDRAGELSRNASVDLIVFQLRTVFGGLFQVWAARQISNTQFAAMRLLLAAQIVAPAVVGAAQGQATRVLRRAMRALAETRSAAEGRFEN
jgi:AcrR family transcriptional regulator